MNRRDERRRFLTEGLAMAAGMVLGSAAAASAAEGKEDALPIVDTHQHLWDLGKFKLPWIQPGTVLARNYLPADYVKATEGLNVVKAVYMEVALDPSQQVEEAEYVIELSRSGKGPTAAGVISGRLASNEFKPYITKYKGNKFIKGVRQVLHGAETPPGYCLQESFVRSVKLLGELGMSYDLCVRSAELPDAAKLVDECTETRFILDHCGNASVQSKDLSPWKRDIAAVAKRRNVVCKVSGIVASAKPGAWSTDDLAPIVRHTLDVFGPDRVMFGGDWPVCLLGATYREWVTALKEIVRDRPREEQRKLFAENAIRFYGLG